MPPPPRCTQLLPPPIAHHTLSPCAECQLDSDLLEATLGLLREVLLQMDNIQVCL